MHIPIRSLGTYIYISIYSYLYALKPFKFTYMAIKIFENTFPPCEGEFEFLACFSLTTSPLPHTTLGYEQWWAAILKNVSFKAIQIHNF
jgi:hypothetical protein